MGLTMLEVGIVAATWTFPLLIVGAVAYLLKLDSDPVIPFKLYHFVSDASGTGNSGSLTYTGIFLVGTWLVWYLAVNKQWGEATTLVGSLGAIFVLGGTVRQLTASRERVGIAKAQQPIADPPPITSETTITGRTTVTSEH